jgi:hypothetical protein
MGGFSSSDSRRSVGAALEQRQAGELTRQSEQLETALVASLGHDLRTPLTAIRIAASNLQTSELEPADRVEQSDVILSETERLTRLFRNLLDMGRIDAGAITTDLRWRHPSEIYSVGPGLLATTTVDTRSAVEFGAPSVVQIPGTGDPLLRSWDLTPDAQHFVRVIETDLDGTLQPPINAVMNWFEDRALVMELVDGEDPSARIAPDHSLRSEARLNSPTITSPAALTMGGVILGTAAYMAPEQTKGKPVDKRADIWAFGCVLYEMVTARRPFEGEDITDTNRYAGQRIFVVRLEDYVYLVPFVENENAIFLKTIIPSRKATKEYLGEESDDEDGR